MSESTFPVPILLPMLEKYAFEHQRGIAPRQWAVEVFEKLQVPNEKIYAVLEAMFYNNEAPFHGPNRRLIANDIVWVAVHWFHETNQGRGQVFGTDANAQQVDQTLDYVLQEGLDESEASVCRSIRARLAQVYN